MRPTNILGGNRQVQENLQWIAVLNAFDLGHPKPLADLILEETIPEELRPAIAKIIDGSRNPDKRRGSLSKVPPDERMAIAASLSVVIDLNELLMKGEIIDQDRRVVRALEHGADRRGIEPIEELRRRQRRMREHIGKTAKRLGVSVETVENMLREFRKKVEKYPDV